MRRKAGPSRPGRSPFSLTESNQRGAPEQANALKTRFAREVSAIASRPHQSVEPVEERHLRGEQLLARGIEAEPAGAVDLRELLVATAARRPLDREGVARDRAGVEVAFDRPRCD